MQIKDLLQDRRLPRLEARMLVEQVWRRSRAWLLAHDDDPVDAAQAAAYEALAQRRLAGEPMAYVIGHREFMGHVFQVTPDVLMPRPDTETLVEAALAFLRDRPGRGYWIWAQVAAPSQFRLPWPVPRPV
ncbi:putative protein methyltransferase [Bordetella holmesii 41130]|nr:putative protein methyltransferase [Bordetella holmesii 41130]